MRLTSLVILLLIASPAWAQMGGGHAPSGIILKDEGTTQGSVKIIDCVGTSIACTKSGGTGTLTLSGGTTVTQVTINFDTCGLGAALPKYTCKVTITDATVTTSSKIILSQTTPGAGRQDDEGEMDALACRTIPAAGTFVLYCDSLVGATHSTWKIAYIVG